MGVQGQLKKFKKNKANNFMLDYQLRFSSNGVRDNFKEMKHVNKCLTEVIPCTFDRICNAVNRNLQIIIAN